MKRLLVCFCLVMISHYSFSQRIIDVEKEQGSTTAANQFYTVAGSPFINAKFVRLVSGSPFFNENMMKGVIFCVDGTQFRNITFRINLLDKQVNFLNYKNEELIVATPIREVMMWDSINDKNYEFVYSDFIETTTKPEKDFYQVLLKGKARLYLQHKKMMREERPYNSATYEQKIETMLIYFVLVGGVWNKANKIKDLPSIFSYKKNEIQQYISSKKLSGSKQEDLVSVVSYYNNLFEKKE